jgi:hypothetical protein
MKRFNLYTNIKHQRRKRIENIIYSTLNWCIEKWGLKEHEIELDLDICYKEHMVSGSDTKAEYCSEWNDMVIYPSQHSNVRDLIDSVIHEFTHQRQDMSDYHKVLTKSGYTNHPLEIEAVETAKKYRKECWYSIRDLINL